MINLTNIERFALHDGPGIRTTIFLKGCPLHCPWCANPETQERKVTLFHDEARCQKCQQCVEVCTQQAISFVENKWQYDKDKCNDCLKCEEVCYPHAIQFQGKQMTNEAILQEVMKDKAYYDHSCGGITISGGEPLVQKEEVMKLLQASKQLGLHTAIETTGYCTLKTIQDVMPYVDLFLYDFKHIDNEILKQTIGAEGEVIKRNLAYLLSVDKDVEVRIPVIPNFNNDEKTLHEMIDYLAMLKVKKLALLPYHNLGKSKYDKMQKVYMMNEPIMNKEQLITYQQYAIQLNIETKIGG